MTLIGHRECHLVEVKNSDLNKFVGEIQTFLKKEKIPKDYVINIHKDAVACCGYFPIGVFVEIQGPNKKPIKDLDFRIYAKILEICEREGIEYHECKPLEVIKTSGGT